MNRQRTNEALTDALTVQMIHLLNEHTCAARGNRAQRSISMINRPACRLRWILESD